MLFKVNFTKSINLNSFKMPITEMHEGLPYFYIDDAG